MKKVALTTAMLIFCISSTLTSFAAWNTSDGGNTYTYTYEDGSIARNGFRLVNGKWYYFDTNGYMQRGWVYKDADWYYMDADGSMHKGWLKDEAKNIWYYLDESTEDSQGRMLKNWQNINGKKYYFNQDGAMQSGRILIDNNETRAKQVYMTDDSGAIKTNLIEDRSKSDRDEDFIMFKFDKEGLLEVATYKTVEKAKEEGFDVSIGLVNGKKALKGTQNDAAWQGYILVE